MIDPRHDLEGFIREQGKSGEMEADPYSYAVRVIATVLEYALDDGINGSMSEGEYDTMTELALRLVELDPNIKLEV